MKTRTILLSSLALVLLLAACGGAAGTGDENGVGGASAVKQVSLSEDDDDALPVDAQLALGSLKLEAELAVDEAQAGQLLPLWQGYQSLLNSDKAAEAELSALLKQIQGVMTPDQVEAIAGMQLTNEDLTSYVQEQGGGFRLGGMMGQTAREDSGGLPGGGFPGGGVPGGGVPGSGVPGGGFPGGGQGNAGNADARATRMAEMGVEGTMAQFMNRAMVGLLITELQITTGELDADELRIAGLMRRAWTVISETTGIPMETLRAEAAGGATFAEIIAAQGGDLEVVKAALREAFSQMPSMEGQDLEQSVSDVLNTPLSTGDSQ